MRTPTNLINVFSAVAELSAQTGRGNGMGFEPDNKIERIAEAYALDAVDLAREKFGTTLDGATLVFKKSRTS